MLGDVQTPSDGGKLQRVSAFSNSAVSCDTTSEVVVVSGEQAPSGMLDGGKLQASPGGKSLGMDASTPVNIPLLTKLLKGWPHASFVINGFSQGFKFHFSGLECGFETRNSMAANLNPEAVDQKLSQEIDLNRIAGPFDYPPLPDFKCSPLSLREKSEPGKFRLLHNLSYPYDETSVNGGIDQKYKTVKYASIQTALHLINKLGRKCYMGKADIKSAYRLVPIHPSQHHLLGFKWRNKYYYDKYLPMGMAESCAIFETISDGLVYIMKSTGVDNIVKVLDDFLFLESSKPDCDCALQKFNFLCKELAIPLVEAKTSKFSAQQIVFLGVQLDTYAMTASLPSDKLCRYTKDASEFLKQETTSLHELQSLIGKLQFATSVIPIGRPFLRRLIDATKERSHRSVIDITEDMRADITMWKTFLGSYNGTSIITPYPICTDYSINLFSDASNIGYGGTYGSNWIQGCWNDTWRGLNIAVRELYPILILVKMFAHLWSNQTVCFHCDNQAIVASLNKQRARNPTIMTLLRPLVLHLMLTNVKFKVVYIKSKDNIIADAISRFQEDQDLLSRYGLKPYPSPVPRHLQPEVIIPSKE